MQIKDYNNMNRWKNRKSYLFFFLKKTTYQKMACKKTYLKHSRLSTAFKSMETWKHAKGCKSLHKKAFLYELQSKHFGALESNHEKLITQSTFACICKFAIKVQTICNIHATFIRDHHLHAFLKDLLVFFALQNTLRFFMNTFLVIYYKTRVWKVFQID